MSKPIFTEPIPTPSTGRSDPSALAAQINAEAEPKPVSEWIAQLLCPAMKPNHYVAGEWGDPDQRFIARVKTDPEWGALVVLTTYLDNGMIDATRKGHGPTVRAAYEHAHHQHRRATYSIEQLFRVGNIWRSLLASANRRNTTLAGTLANLQYTYDRVVIGKREMAECARLESEKVKRLTQQRTRALQRARARGRRPGDVSALQKTLSKTQVDLKAALEWKAVAHGKQDELNAARAALQATPVTAMGVSFADVRRVLVQVYPEGDKLALDKRILGLAKERDIWKARANRAEAANRADTRAVVHAAQRISAPDPDDSIPFPMTDKVPGESHGNPHV